MNRELKFRGWCITREEMLDIQKISFKFKKVMPNGWNMAWDDLNFEIMQFTGLKDKNGKEIYEGDIVVASWYSYDEPLDDTTGEVIFNQGWMSYCIWNEDDKTMSEMNGQGSYTWEIEVIGNKYENKDLLNTTN